MRWGRVRGWRKGELEGGDFDLREEEEELGSLTLP